MNEWKNEEFSDIMKGSKECYNATRKEHRVYIAAKRVFDLLVSFFAVCLLFPVFLVISVIIKCTDKGPVFYSHKRVGMNGEPVDVLKFRSMKVGADDLESMLTEEQLEEYRKEFKLEVDPRITPIGQFLRKTSLDELPQLLNILQGNLSIVGPRPVLMEELHHYSKEEVAKLLSVKPGLTGYWQAYARNSARYEDGKRQEMELYYVDHAGMLFDWKIIFKTAFSVLKQENVSGYKSTDE